MSILELIVLSFRYGGIFQLSQTIYAEDIWAAFQALNMLISEWNRERWLIWSLTDTFLTSDGSLSYSVGPGMDFNIPRPDRLEDGCFARLVQTEGSASPVDFPLGIIPSHEDYASISLKQLTTFPTSIFLDSGYPTGNVYVWPVPTAGQYQIHILTKNPISQFVAPTDSIAMPPEYLNAIMWNLAARLRVLNALQPDPTVSGFAKGSLSVIRGANAQIPNLSLPGILLPRRGGIDPVLGSFNGLPWSY